MAFTVTNRGYAFSWFASADMASNTFTPAANSVLIVVSAQSDDKDLTSITGHGTWSRIYDYDTALTNNYRMQVWACIVGGSPSSGAITVAGGYQPNTCVEFYEITDVDISGGTAASCFGANGGANGYDLRAETVTLSAFGSSANMVFAIAGISSNPSNTLTYSEGTFTTGTLRNDHIVFQAAWYLSEDTTVDVTFQNATSDMMYAFEIKKAGGGSGEVSGTPLQNLGSGFGPARAARINGVLQ